MKLAVIAALTVCACKQSQPPPVPAPDPSDVVVQSPGGEPRRELRYALAKGAKSTIVLSIDTQLTAGELGGAMPTLAVTLELAVEDVLPDGSMRLRTTVVDAAAHDRDGAKASAQAATNVLDEMKGLAIVATLSPLGRVHDAHVDAGAKKLPEPMVSQLGALTRSFDQVAMPLPRAAVGPTAKWTTTRKLDLDGMAVTSTSTVELVSVNGDKVGFAMKSVMQGPDQQVTRQGLSIDVTNLHGTGSGEGTVDLAKLATAAKFESTLHSEMLAAGEKTPIDMAMKLDLSPVQK
jgi:hypothetical protein